MIIVEGADNVGKSTLVRNLIEKDPLLEKLKRPRYKADRGESIGTSYLDTIAPPGLPDRASLSNGVADRFLASECIYGDLFRGGSRLTSAEHFSIIRLLFSYRALVIFCNPPNEVILETWDHREQYKDDPIAIADAYRSKIRSIFHPIPVWEYDWTADPNQSLLDRFIQDHRRDQYSEYQRLVWWSGMPMIAGIGNLWNPNLVVVSDGVEDRNDIRSDIYFAEEFNTPLLDGLEECRKAGGACSTAIDRCYLTMANKAQPNSVGILRSELSWICRPETVILTTGPSAFEMVNFVIPGIFQFKEWIHADPSSPDFVNTLTRALMK